jgi:DNA-binding transcriptional LysR family regulator
MDLHQLRIFVMVAEEENLTRGAQRLSVTPPTVSAHIKTLEDELGVTLFIRTPKGMELTDKGQLLKAKAERALHAAQDLVHHATALQSQLIGRLRCGLNASPSFLRVAALVHHMQDACPGITLELLASSSGSILDALIQETLDAGYIFGASPTPAITAHYVGQAEVVIAAPRAWAPRLATADWATLATLPWISSDSYCPFETLTAELFQQRGLQPQRVVQSHDEATKAELVAAGVGLAMLERSETDQAPYAERLVRWPTPPLYCALHLATLTRRQDDPLLRALQTAVLQVWDKMLTPGVGLPVSALQSPLVSGRAGETIDECPLVVDIYGRKPIEK